MIKHSLLLVISCTTFLLSTGVKAKVEVNINGAGYSFSTQPRLSEVLSPVAAMDNWYWPASRLYRNSDVVSSNLKKQVLNSLIEHSAKNNRYTSSYQSIAQEIGSWSLLDTVLINIDFDLARISQSDNPLFEPDQYEMFLTPRPSTLYIFGAVNEALVISYPDNTCIHNMLSQVTMLNGADKSQVYIIDPSGNIRTVATAYYSKHCVSLIPGAIIFVPLQEGLLLNHHAIINMDIAKLVMHRTQR